MTASRYAGGSVLVNISISPPTDPGEFVEGQLAGLLGRVLLADGRPQGGAVVFGAERVA